MCFLLLQCSDFQRLRLSRSVAPLKHKFLAPEDQWKQRYCPATAPMVLQECVAAGDVGHSKNGERFAILTAKLPDLEYDYIQPEQPVFQEDLQFDVVDILRDLGLDTISTNTGT
jgi:hypothetical protein